MTFRSKKIIRSTKLFVLVAAGVVLMLCSNESNPYRNPAVASIAITEIDQDTISIFTTRTLGVQLLLPAQVDSVRVHVDNNRLWSTGDTVLHRSAFSSNPVRLSLSFADTGAKKITATAYISDQTTRYAEKILNCHSPLVQKNITAAMGDTLTLSTAPVGDQVLYVWDFGNGNEVINDRPTIPYTMTGKETPLCRLSVRSAPDTSPQSRFTVTLIDITPPAITLLNTKGITRSGDTIRTGTNPFILRVRVDDAASGIDLITMNGRPFDTEIPNGTIDTIECIKTISEPDLSSVKPYPALIQVRDTKYNPDTVCFYILLDTTIPPTNDNPTLQILVPNSDFTTVQNPTLYITGIMDGNYSNATYHLSAQVGDSIYPKSHTITGTSKIWYDTVTLDSGANLIHMRLSTSPTPLTGIITTKSFTVNYNPGAQDVEAPTIIDVKSGDMSIPNNHITDQPSLPIRVIAYDNGSGMQSVTLNGTPTTDSAGKGNTFLGVMALTHKKTGDTLTVLATDKAGKTATRVLTIFRNTPPTLTVPASGTFIVVGSDYTGVVTTADADGDTPMVSIIVTHGPASARKDTTIIPGPTGAFKWTPLVRDTASLVLFTVRAYDGMQSTEKTFSAAVIANTAIKDTTRFVTTTQAFPETLQVGRDTLKVTMRFLQTSGTNRGLLSARLLAPPADTLLLNNTLDSIIRWVPQAQDIGRRTLVATVTSSSGFVDSLKPVIVVTSPITAAYETMASGAVEAAGPCSIAVALSRPSRDTVRIGYTVNRTLSSADTGDYRITSPIPLLFIPGSTRQQIRLGIVNDTLPESGDTIAVDLVNATGGVKITDPRIHRHAIINDDTARTPPVDTPAVYFAAHDTAGPRASYTIQVPVRLTKPALQTGTVTIFPSGTAALSTEYRLSTTTLTFVTGDTLKFFGLIIIGGTLSKTDKNILLTLSNLTGMIKQGTKPSFAFTILKNDTLPPKKKVVLIRAPGTITWADQAIVDTIAKLGYAPVQAIEGALVADSFAGASAIVISRSNRTATVTSQLISALRIPILCASERLHIYLGLAADGDTGRSSNNAVLIPSVNGIVTQYSGTVQFFNQNQELLYNDYQSLPHKIATNNGVTRSYIWAYDSSQTLRSGSRAPARRMAFYMPEPLPASWVIRPEWWGVLKRCIQWSVEGK